MTNPESNIDCSQFIEVVIGKNLRHRPANNIYPVKKMLDGGMCSGTK